MKKIGRSAVDFIREYYLSLDRGNPVRRVFTFLRRIHYFGSRVVCPFCGGGFRRMIPWKNINPVCSSLDITGAADVENYRCPGCNSIDRERHLWIYLRYVSGLLENPGRVLHIAPERNLKGRLKAVQGIRYYSADLMAQGYGPEIYGQDTLPVDLTSLPFRDSLFNLMICSHVLEHIDDDASALAELFRVCARGGCCLLMVPLSEVLQTTLEDSEIVDPAQREREFGQRDHVRVYGGDFAARLENAGFKVETFSLSRLFHGRWARLFAVNPREQIFLAWKPF